MSNYSEPPFMANGDWIDGAWLNQYLRDNFRTVWQVQAAEDLIVGASPSTAKRLAKGANGTVLGVNVSGNLAYTTPAALLGIMPLVAGQAADDLIAAMGASNLKRVAKGANNTIFGVNGSGALAYQTLLQLVAAAPTAVTLPMCLTARTGARTISNATHTNAGIQTTLHNTSGFIVANDEIEIPTGMGGLYLMMGHCNWEVNENNIRQMSVGGQVVDTRWGQPGVAVTGSGWAIGALSAGNKVTLSVWQNSGITLWLNQARILLVRIAAI
jgi:hypothetical protein